MSKLVEELLLLSKLENEEPKRSLESISVSEIINQIHHRATSLKNTGSQLFSLETDDTLKIQGSEEELYIVFKYNLQCSQIYERGFWCHTNQMATDYRRFSKI